MNRNCNWKNWFECGKIVFFFFNNGQIKLFSRETEALLLSVLLRKSKFGLFEIPGNCDGLKVEKEAENKKDNFKKGSNGDREVQKSSVQQQLGCDARVHKIIKVCISKK